MWAVHLPQESHRHEERQPPSPTVLGPVEGQLLLLPVLRAPGGPSPGCQGQDWSPQPPGQCSPTPWPCSVWLRDLPGWLTCGHSSLPFLKTQFENPAATKYRQPEETTDCFRREVFTL